MKTALVCGGGGFIGGHLINRLKKGRLFCKRD
jgi:nucleoside-diphosphate-sugar epimerase